MKPIKQTFFNTIANDFDNHVRQSIPLFDNFINNLRFNIINNNYQNIIDICGSTGKLGVDLYKQGYNGNYYNLDGSPKMIELAKENQIYYPKMKSILGGFMATWHDSDNNIHIPEIDINKIINKRFSLVLEILGFQFFSKTREKEILNLKQSSDVCVFVEKFNDNDIVKWQIQEIYKDMKWKNKFFTNEEIENKKTNVLNDMGKYCFEINNFKTILYKHFKNVLMIYKAGNFAGFICSDKDITYQIDNKLLINDFNV